MTGLFHNVIKGPSTLSHTAEFSSFLRPDMGHLGASVSQASACSSGHDLGVLGQALCPVPSSAGSPLLLLFLPFPLLMLFFLSLFLSQMNKWNLKKKSLNYNCARFNWPNWLQAGARKVLVGGKSKCIFHGGGVRIVVARRLTRANCTFQNGSNNTFQLTLHGLEHSLHSLSLNFGGLVWLACDSKNEVAIVLHGFYG